MFIIIAYLLKLFIVPILIVLYVYCSLTIIRFRYFYQLNALWTMSILSDRVLQRCSFPIFKNVLIIEKIYSRSGINYDLHCYNKKVLLYYD